MAEHYPIHRQVIAMDTTDDDLTILPGTMRVERQARCGCTHSLEHRYGEGVHLAPTDQPTDHGGWEDH